MITLQNILLFVCLVPAVILFLYMMVFFLGLKKVHQPSTKTPKVSIMITARNESENIAKCLAAIDALNYPTQKLQIILGNDRSEDNTLEQMQNFASSRKHVDVVDIQKDLDGQKGKANVLAQLAQKATGKFYFFTDADVEVPEDWLVQMLPHFEEKVGIVTGMTVVKSKTLGGIFQCIDWIFAISILKILSDFRIPVSAMGNNMAVTKEAYESVGGFEKIPFNVTEDFEIFKQLVKKKWKFKNLFYPQVTASTEPIRSFKTLLHQRKRWMKGAVKLHWSLVLVLVSLGVYYPCVIALLIINPWFGLAVLVLKTVVQSLYQMMLLERLEKLKLIIFVPLYEIYAAILTIPLLLFYILPIKVDWKGRKY